MRSILSLLFLLFLFILIFALLGMQVGRLGKQVLDPEWCWKYVLEGMFWCVMATNCFSEALYDLLRTTLLSGNACIVSYAWLKQLQVILLFTVQSTRSAQLFCFDSITLLLARKRSTFPTLMPKCVLEISLRNTWMRNDTGHTETPSFTVFENYRKSLIQHCERSELRLRFEWTKVN